MVSQRLTPQELDRLLKAEPALLAPTGSESSLLRTLASIERSSLDQLMTEQHHAAGEVIFREGEIGDSAYLIWSGRVAVVRGSFQSPTVLGYRGPGDVVGEMALLENRPRSASIVALENLRVLRIGRESFQQLLNSNPAIRRKIMTSLSARLREAAEVREVAAQVERQLVRQVSELHTEREHLLEHQRVRQETSDLIIHDLCSPLGAISGAVQLLGMVLPADVLQANQQLLDIANSATDRMQRLVDSLLDVARLESGEARLRLAKTDLRLLIEEAIKRASLALKEKRITSHTRIPAGLPTILADEVRIDRVLGNLIDNAVRYTPKGGQLNVAAEVQEDQVVVSVTDTGPGIPPEERERIFERFAQLPRDRSRRRGFGLGLAFCRLAVEAHGGQIWVESGERGIGSRFVFTLPLSSLPAAGDEGKPG